MHLKLQLMVPLTMQSRGCTFESQIWFFTHSFCVIQRRTKRIVDISKLRSIDKVRMRVRVRGKSGQNHNLLLQWCHSFLKVHARETQNQKCFGLFHSVYVLSGCHRSKKQHHKNFCLQLLACVGSVTMGHICIR